MCERERPIDPINHKKSRERKEDSSQSPAQTVVSPNLLKIFSGVFSPLSSPALKMDGGGGGATVALAEKGKKISSLFFSPGSFLFNKWEIDKLRLAREVEREKWKRDRGSKRTQIIGIRGTGSGGTNHPSFPFCFLVFLLLFFCSHTTRPLLGSSTSVYPSIPLPHPLRAFHS